MNLYGIVDLHLLSHDWYTKTLPEPTWITSQLFDEKFSCFHSDGTIFYCTTSIGCSTKLDRRIVKVDMTKPTRTSWVEILPETVLKTRTMAHQYSHVYDGKILLQYYVDGWTRFYVYTLEPAGKFIAEVKMPQDGSVEKVTGDHDSPDVFYDLKRPGQAKVVYRLDMRTLKSSVYLEVDKDKLKGQPDMSWLAVDQIKYPSKDGTMVPMTILRNKDVLPSLDFKPKQPIPTIIHAYGGFGVIEKVTGTPDEYVWLKNLRGLYVVPHIRGGGEQGLGWAAAGNKGNRKSSIEDMTSAAEWLQKVKGFTDVAHTAITGGSNGGMVAAVTANTRPDLFAAVFSRVPVTDMLRFQHFTIGNSWIPEYGCSEKASDVNFLLGYSPLHNVHAVKYPTMVVSTGDNDDRVIPSHTYKLVATLQDVAGRVPGSGPIFLNVQRRAGHNSGGLKRHSAANVMMQVMGLKWYD